MHNWHMWQNGASLDITNMALQTPLHYCYAYKYVALASYLEGMANPCPCPYTPNLMYYLANSLETTTLM